MEWRRCLRLITVDETTVSSSQSSSSSQLLLFALLRLHLRRFDASLLSSPFSIFPVFSHSLHRDVLNILFSLSDSSFFQVLPDLVSLHSPRSVSFFSLWRRLLVSSSFFCIPPRHLLHFTRLSILFPWTPCFNVILFFLLSYTGKTRVRRLPRTGLDSTFRIVIEREHDR